MVFNIHVYVCACISDHGDVKCTVKLDSDYAGGLSVMIAFTWHGIFSDKIYSETMDWSAIYLLQ